MKKKTNERGAKLEIRLTDTFCDASGAFAEVQ
jgi:hypothetical protein